MTYLVTTITKQNQIEFSKETHNTTLCLYIDREKSLVFKEKSEFLFVQRFIKYYFT